MTTGVSPSSLRFQFPRAPTPRKPQDRRLRTMEQLKMLLPVVASLFLCLILIWPWMNERLSALSMVAPFDYRSADTSTIMNPRFMGSDHNDDPFVVTAAAATNMPEDGDWMYLEGPKAELTQESGRWISLTSDTGFVSQTRNLIALQENVFLYRDDGVEFSTEGAVIDMATNRAFGQNPVEGAGPGFSITSNEGFEIEDGGSLIRFLGGCRLILRSTTDPDDANAP